jgi:hypothetical protein
MKEQGKRVLCVRDENICDWICSAIGLPELRKREIKLKKRVRLTEFMFEYFIEFSLKV